MHLIGLFYGSTCAWVALGPAEHGLGRLCHPDSCADARIRGACRDAIAGDGDCLSGGQQAFGWDVTVVVAAAEMTERTGLAAPAPRLKADAFCDAIQGAQGL